MNSFNTHITISAAGKATRIRDWMHQVGMGEGTPKSVLPTGAGETLLGRIVRQAMHVGDVQVFGNYDTMRGLGECSDLPRDVSLVVNRNITGPLGPIYLDALRTQRQSYMAAGDFWAEFNWLDFINFHNGHSHPASILLAPSVPAKSGARFDVDDDGGVLAWQRVEQTTGSDLINIGGYILDGDNHSLMTTIAELNGVTHKEDAFNDALIASGSMAAYVLDTPAFNVNDESIYQSMYDYSKSRPVVDEPKPRVPITFIPNAP